jgi:hypothetical protein
MLRRKLILLSLVILIATSIIWMPLTVYAVTDNMDKFQYYVEALKAMVDSLRETLNAIIELFKVAVKP